MGDMLEFLNEHDLKLSVDVLFEAFTHPSILHDQQDLKTYERLETIGDAVLDLLVLDKLNSLNPTSDPEFLTKQRSYIVNNATLASFGKSLNFAHLIQRRVDYELVKKDYSDIVESLFGALFIDQGYEACVGFLDKQWETLISYSHEVISLQGENPIGKLQELLQKRGLDIPVYSMVDQDGSSHDPLFTMQVMVNLGSNQLIEVAQASNKQRARVSAAKKLLHNSTFQEFCQVFT